MRTSSVITGPVAEPARLAKRLRFASLVKGGVRKLRAGSDREPAVPAWVGSFWQGAGQVDPGSRKQLEAGRSIGTRDLRDVSREVADRLVQRLSGVSPGTDPQRLVVRFDGGRLQGLACVVHVQGRRVSCRLRADGAALRKALDRVRGQVAGRLASAGFRLAEFEVGR